MANKEPSTADLLALLLKALASNAAELLRADDAATLCGVSRATWDRLRAAGAVPRPVQLGGSILWSRTTLLEWIANGCEKP